MANINKTPINRLFSLILLLSLVLSPWMIGSNPVDSAQAQEYIVQARDMGSAAAVVKNIRGVVTHELSIINAVGAKLTASQYARLSNMAGVKVYQNSQLEIAVASVSWDGGGASDQWSDPANWSSDMLPTSADTVQIVDGNTVIVDGNVDVNDFIMMGGDVQFAAGGYTLGIKNALVTITRCSIPVQRY